MSGEAQPRRREEWLDDIERLGGVHFRPSTVFRVANLIEKVQTEMADAVRKVCERDGVKATHDRMNQVLDIFEKEAGGGALFDRKKWTAAMDKVIGNECDIPF